MCVTWTQHTATGTVAIRKAQLQPALPIYCGIAAEAETIKPGATANGLPFAA